MHASRHASTGGAEQRYCVVGAGILGLAVARQLTIEEPGASVVVLDKEDGVATHQTGRNSGVVHAGLYYEPGSLKARLCRRGVGLLRTYCRTRRIAYEECGKVVVATRPDELPRLARIHERAVANGVPGIRLLGAADLRDVEPHVAGIAALHSAGTAVVDYRAVATAFAHDVVAAGGEVRLRTSVRRIRDERGGPALELDDGEVLRCDRAVVCAGLHADRLASASGHSSMPAIVPFRGEYFVIRAESRSLVRGLIYPVPDPALPFLGVHLTRRIDGAVLVGPNAVLAMAREGYRRRVIDRREVGELLSSRATWRLFARYWRVGVSELARSGSRRLFAASARRFVPALRAADLVRAPAGVRAQAIGPDGSLLDDFRMESAGGVVWVRNAPSPAATSSMAIAEEIVERLLRRRSSLRRP